MTRPTMTVEYRQGDNGQIIIIIRRPGAETVRTIADTVPPRKPAAK